MTDRWPDSGRSHDLDLQVDLVDLVLDSQTGPLMEGLRRVLDHHFEALTRQVSRRALRIEKLIAASVTDPADKAALEEALAALTQADQTVDAIEP